MPDNPDPEIQQILTDLDGILSGLDDQTAGSSPPAVNAGSPPAANPVTPPPAAKPVAPPPAAKPLLAPPVAKLAPPPAAKPVAPPPAANASPAAKPVAPAAAPVQPPLRIELPPRAGTISSAKAPEPAEAAKPKPTGLASHPPLEIKLEGTPASPAPPAATASAPAPASPPPSAEIPAGVPKDQIRRLAVLWAAQSAQDRDVFIAFLDQQALTISKKPLHLRKALLEEVSPTTDTRSLLGRVTSAGAVAGVGLFDGLPDAKAREIADALTTAGILFRAVASSETQKRSVAVDLIVDMLLLSPEA